MVDLSFYKGKKVLITGHTGFKGSWMCHLLLLAGANVFGYSLPAPTNPSMFELCKLSYDINSIIGDIRDLEHLKKVFAKIQPEIVIHMAAQPIVRKSYRSPVYTYETNIMGTVNILECIRLTPCVRSFVNVTTDKVYLDKEWDHGYREDEELNGHDPYSNSKSCSELITSCYLKSYFQNSDTAITTCRSGNAIGGGDFAPDRIIPDCVRAAKNNEEILVRNPLAIRPYQHVLEPIVAYLTLAKEQYINKSVSGNYNIGPDETDCLTTKSLVELFCSEWEKLSGQHVSWVNQSIDEYHESNLLKLDCTKIKKTFGWAPKWNIETCMKKIVEWYGCYQSQGNIISCTQKQILEYCKF